MECERNGNGVFVWLTGLFAPHCCAKSEFAPIRLRTESEIPQFQGMLRWKWDTEPRYGPAISVPVGPGLQMNE